VPSLNDLNAFRAIQSPMHTSLFKKKSKNGNSFARFNLYNSVKQDWKKKTISAVIKQGFDAVHHSYFHYLIIEQTKKRDPSNICSAGIKFVEDGLIEAGVIPNDGWKNVLGIRIHWHHEPKCEPGIYVMMSDIRVDEENLVFHFNQYITERSLNV
jgi:hypothetical protein